MTQTPGVAVTYTGNDDPFVDRIYRSGLTFAHGQTRSVPPTLAERLLRHADVFKPAEASSAPDDQTASTSTSTTEPPKDDTATLLDDAAKKEADQRQLDEARFALLDQIESMDKPALLEFAQVKFQQKLAGNLGVAKLRDAVRGFVDQYGMP